MLDGERFYWVSGQDEKAIGLSDGSLLWSQHLTGPEAGWALALTERCVLAFPGPAATRDRGDNEIDGLPLVFRRRDNGALVQRLFFPVTLSGVAVRLAPRAPWWPPAAGSGRWASGERSRRAADSR